MLVRCDELGFSSWRATKHVTKLKQNPRGMFAVVVSLLHCYVFCMFACACHTALSVSLVLVVKDKIGKASLKTNCSG